MSFRIDIDPFDFKFLVLHLTEELRKETELRDSFLAQADDASSRMNALEAKIAGYLVAGGQHLHLSNEEADKINPPIGPSGRVQRGATEKLVLAYLKQRNGEGGSIDDIKNGTGTTYATVRRALLKHQENGVVRVDGDRWHFVSTPFEDLSEREQNEKGPDV